MGLLLVLALGPHLRPAFAQDAPRASRTAAPAERALLDVDAVPGTGYALLPAATQLPALRETHRDLLRLPVLPENGADTPRPTGLRTRPPARPHVGTPPAAPPLYCLLRSYRI